MTSMAIGRPPPPPLNFGEKGFFSGQATIGELEVVEEVVEVL